MKPKTITELEKEIEEWTYPILDRNSKKKSRIEEVYDYKKDILKATLSQTIAIKEMILGLIKEEKEYTDIEDKLTKEELNLLKILEFKIIKELQGEELTEVEDEN